MTTGSYDARKKRRCLAYIVAGIIIQTLIIVLFVLLVMRIKTPKVRLGSVSVVSSNLNSSSNSPSFNLKLNAEVTVKNKNFGNFKFESSTASFSYRGTEVGKTTIAEASAKARSTKRFNVTVSLDSNKASSKSHLGSDLSSKKLTFVASAKLSGKVHLLKVFKKKKSAEMNCTFVVDTATKKIDDLSCK